MFSKRHSCNRWKTVHWIMLKYTWCCLKEPGSLQIVGWFWLEMWKSIARLRPNNFSPPHTHMSIPLVVPLLFWWRTMWWMNIQYHSRYRLVQRLYFSPSFNLRPLCCTLFMFLLFSPTCLCGLDHCCTPLTRQVIQWTLITSRCLMIFRWQTIWGNLWYWLALSAPCSLYLSYSLDWIFPFPTSPCSRE